MWRRVQVHTIERGKNVLSLDNNPRANQPAQGEPPRALPPGTLVPDFPFQSTPDHAVSLRDFRGHPVILAFYSAIGCGDQMALSNEILPSLTASRPSCSGSQWMESGVMPLLPGQKREPCRTGKKIVRSTGRRPSSQISSPRSGVLVHLLRRSKPVAVTLTLLPVPGAFPQPTTRR